MSWRDDLVARLGSEPALSSALGDRIAWFEAQRGWTEYPQLVLQEIDPGREYTHDGPDGLDQPRVQFDIYATDPADLQTVEAALMTEMEQAETDAGDTRFHFGFLVLRRFGEVEDLPDQRRLFRLTMDFEFHWETV